MANQLKLDVVVNDHGGVAKLRQVEGGVRGVERAAGPAAAGIGGMAAGMKRVVGAAAGFVAVSGAFRLVGNAARFAVSSSITMNSTLETATLQFGTLMGSADAAEAHVRSLFEFAKRTPFETGPILEASRQLEAFGGEALNNNAILLTLGDTSAATGAGFEVLAFWVGRLFSALQAGKPFGEAALRLQELTVLTPEARQNLEDLQEAGADAETIFASFTDSLGRFTGAMETQADTWAGLTSTLKDEIGLGIAGATTGFFDAAKAAMQWARDTGAVDAALGNLFPGLQLANALASQWAAEQRGAAEAVRDTEQAADAATVSVARLNEGMARFSGLASALIPGAMPFTIPGPPIGSEGVTPRQPFPFPLPPGGILPTPLRRGGGGMIFDENNQMVGTPFYGLPRELWDQAPPGGILPTQLRRGGGGMIFDENNQMVGTPFYGLPRELWDQAAVGGGGGAISGPSVSAPTSQRPGPASFANPFLSDRARPGGGMAFGGGGGGGTIINIQVNAQGSFFETDRALEKLADRIAEVFVRAGRVGATVGARG